MGLFTVSIGLYFVIMMLYIMSWVILLSGIAAVQQNCNSNIPYYVKYETSALLANSVGQHCNRMFRLAWFVVFLCLIPLFVEFGFLVATVLMKAKSGGRSMVGKAASLFAVIAVLCILFANQFYRMVETGGLFATSPVIPNTITNRMRARFRCAVAGFSLVAAFALLLMFVAPWCESGNHGDSGTTGTTGGKRRVTEPTGGPAPATTTAAAPAPAATTAQPVV